LLESKDATQCSDGYLPELDGREGANIQPMLLMSIREKDPENVCEI
jgi:hypothetical protein